MHAEPPAVLGLDLPLAGREGVDDLEDPAAEVGHVHPELQVLEGAPHIPGQDVGHLARGRREAPHAALQVDDDERQLDAGEDVDEVAGELVELRVAVPELVVDGAQLLVRGLQLLLGALQLLVRGLQLLVGRDELLVGRGELVGGRLMVHHERLHVVPRRGQLGPQALEVLARGLPGARAGGPLGPRRARGRLLEQDEEVPLGRPGGPLERQHLQVHGADLVAGPDPQPLPPDRDGLGRGPLERLVEVRREPLARHPQHVRLRLAGRRLEVGARAPAELHDLQPVVDEHAHRRVARQQEVVGLPLRLARGVPPVRQRAVGAPQVGLSPGGEGEDARPALAHLGEEPVRRVDRLEQVAEAADGLALPEEQVAPLVEAVVQHREDAALQVGVEVDEHVAAADEVEPGEGGVAGEVVLDEDAQVAHALPDPVAALGRVEEAGQALARHIAHGGRRVDAGAGRVDRLGAQVRPEELDRDALGGGRQDLEQADGDRVGLLARRAPRHPDADRAAVDLPLARHQRPERALLEGRERLRVAEERGDVDQHVLGERPGLGRVLAERGQVLRKPARPAQGHAPLDPPQDRGALVAGEVEPRALAHEPEHIREALRGPGRLRLARALALGRPPRDQVGVTAEARELAGDLGRGAAEVDAARGDRARGHAPELGRAGLLGHGDPARGLDRAQTLGAVDAGAGEDDADGLVPAVVGQRAEERVEREVQPGPLPPGDERQGAVPDGQVGVGRDHVDAVRRQRHAVGRLDDAQGRDPLEDPREHARPRGVEVQDHDERQARVHGHLGQELPQGLEAAGRRAEGDHDGRGRGVAGCLCGSHGGTSGAASWLRDRRERDGRNEGRRSRPPLSSHRAASQAGLVVPRSAGPLGACPRGAAGRRAARREAPRAGNLARSPADTCYIDAQSRGRRLRFGVCIRLWLLPAALLRRLGDPSCSIP